MCRSSFKSAAHTTISKMLHEPAEVQWEGEEALRKAKVELERLRMAANDLNKTIDRLHRFNYTGPPNRLDHFNRVGSVLGRKIYEPLLPYFFVEVQTSPTQFAVWYRSFFGNGEHRLYFDESVHSAFLVVLLQRFVMSPNLRTHLIDALYLVAQRERLEREDNSHAPFGGNAESRRKLEEKEQAIRAGMQEIFISLTRLMSISKLAAAIKATAEDSNDEQPPEQPSEPASKRRTLRDSVRPPKRYKK